MPNDTNNTNATTTARPPRELTRIQTLVLGAIRQRISDGLPIKASELAKDVGTTSSGIAHACKGLRDKGRIGMLGMSVATVTIVDPMRTWISMFRNAASWESSPPEIHSDEAPDFGSPEMMPCAESDADAQERRQLDIDSHIDRARQAEIEATDALDRAQL